MSKPATERPKRLVLRRRHAKSRGQSLVEFAIILPVFMLLFATTLDLGRLAMRGSPSRTQRARAPSRQRDADLDKPGLPCDTTTNLVVCRILLEATGLRRHDRPGDIALSCDPDCTTGMGNRVTVSVVGHFQLLTTILSSFFGGCQTIAFSSSSTNQIEMLPVPSATPTPTPSPSPSPSPSPNPSPSPASRRAEPQSEPRPSPTPSPACTAERRLHPLRVADQHAEAGDDHGRRHLDPAGAASPRGCGTGVTASSYGKVPGTHTYSSRARTRSRSR